MNCTQCHAAVEPDARFCGECGHALFDSLRGSEAESVEGKLGARRLRQPFWIGLTIFCSVLLAALAFLVYERTRAAAYVNGEKISHSAWRSEVTLAKPQVESRYGPAVFQGPQGQENYKIFRYQVLESLIIDRLLRQEAKRLGVSVAPQEARLKLTGMVGKEGSELEEFLKQHDLSLKQALQMMQRELLQERLVSSQLSPQGRINWEPQQYQQASQIYLNNLWSQAQIRFVDRELQRPPRQNSGAGGCCGSGPGGGGGGCGSKSPQPLDPKIEQEARQTALKAYQEKYGPAQVIAAVTNYGCHIQMDIVNQGKILKSYAFREGKAEEIN
jgi:hypothetical protein